MRWMNMRSTPKTLSGCNEHSMSSTESVSYSLKPDFDLLFIESWKLYFRFKQTKIKII